MTFFWVSDHLVYSQIIFGQSETLSYISTCINCDHTKFINSSWGVCGENCNFSRPIYSLKMSLSVTNSRSCRSSFFAIFKKISYFYFSYLGKHQTRAQRKNVAPNGVTKWRHIFSHFSKTIYNRTKFGAHLRSAFQKWIQRQVSKKKSLGNFFFHCRTNTHFSKCPSVPTWLCLFSLIWAQKQYPIIKNYAVWKSRFTKKFNQDFYRTISNINFIVDL